MSIFQLIEKGIKALLSSIPEQGLENLVIFRFGVEVFKESAVVELEKLVIVNVGSFERSFDRRLTGIREGGNDEDVGHIFSKELKDGAEVVTLLSSQARVRRLDHEADSIEVINTSLALVLEKVFDGCSGFLVSC